MCMLCVCSQLYVVYAPGFYFECIRMEKQDEFVKIHKMFLSLRFISAVCGFISVFILLIDARHRLEKIYSVWTFVRYWMHEYIGIQGWNWNETFPYRKIRTLIFRISRNCVLCTSYSSVRLFFAHLHAHTNTHTQRQNIHWRALIKTNSNKFPERMKTNDGNKIRTKRKKVKKKWKNENKICRFISFSRFFVCLLFLLLILLLCKIYDEITVHNTHTHARTPKKRKQELDSVIVKKLFTLSIWWIWTFFLLSSSQFLASILFFVLLLLLAKIHSHQIEIWIWCNHKRVCPKIV